MRKPNSTVSSSVEHTDEDTELDLELPSLGTTELPKSIENRFKEIKQHILGFHSLHEAGYETAMTIAGFSEFTEIRVRGISVYESGALYVEGEDHSGGWISIFGHLDKISYALTRAKSAGKKKVTQEIEFTLVSSEAYQ